MLSFINTYQHSDTNDKDQLNKTSLKAPAQEAPYRRIQTKLRSSLFQNQKI